MKIKKYVGKTSHEAMLKLKMELGPDAVVLTTRNVRSKGIAKYFKKPLVEITAAFEQKDLLSRNSGRHYDSRIDNINEEITELKHLMKSQTSNNINNNKSSFPSVLDKYHDNMVENGVSSYISSNLLKTIGEQININDKDSKTIKKIIKYNLSEILGDPKPIDLEEDQEVIFFIGPTGVGKTTTLAKIATNLILKENRSIGMITADTYRIAAVEQLKTYSDILQLPLEIVYNEDDLIKAIDNFKEKNIILVDTAGRNHNDTKQLEELKNLLNTIENKKVYLILDSTSDYKLLENLILKYDFIDDYKIIITKIDESNNYGSLLNIKYISNKELSYFTNGQNVPGDIKVIDKEFIVERLIEENNNDRPGR